MDLVKELSPEFKGTRPNLRRFTELIIQICVFRP